MLRQYETEKLTLYFYKAQAQRKQGNTNMMIPLNGYPPVLVEIGDQPVTIAQGPHAKQSGQNNFADYWTTDKTTVTIDGSDTIELSGYTLFTSTTVISVVFQSESLTSSSEEPIVPFEPCFEGDYEMYVDYLEELFYEDKKNVKAKLRKRKAERLSETVVVLKEEDNAESIKKNFETFKEETPHTVSTIECLLLV